MPNVFKSVGENNQPQNGKNNNDEKMNIGNRKGMKLSFEGHRPDVENRKYKTKCCNL